MTLSKDIAYSEHLITLKVQLATGTKVVDEETVTTHTLSAKIDGGDFIIKSGLTDDEVITQIPVLQDQAEARIDIIGTPSDSPLVEGLLGIGFEIDS